MTTFTGCGTALVTPFRKDQSLDEETFVGEITCAKLEYL